MLRVANVVTCLFSHCFNSRVHTRPAGSGFHLRSAVHTALILPAGTNPGLHLKNISVPSSVFRYGSMEPFVGEVGPLQLTVEKKEVA